MGKASNQENKLDQANYQNMAAAYPQVLVSQRTLFPLEADYIHALEDVLATVQSTSDSIRVGNRYWRSPC